MAKEFMDMMASGDTLGIIIKVWFFFMFMPAVLFMALAFWISALKEIM